MMNKKPSDILQDWAFKYDSAENLCDTFERLGLGNSAWCLSCGDYGCANVMPGFIDRITKTESNNECDKK